MVKDHSDRREETRCRHIGYSFRLAARVLLYASSHRQDNTYHSLCYTSRGALAGTKNSSMGPPLEGSIRRPIAPWANALTTELHLAPDFNEMATIFVKYIVYIWRFVSVAKEYEHIKSAAMLFYFSAYIHIIIIHLRFKHSATGIHRYL